MTTLLNDSSIQDTQA